eukprot:11198186-Lingulodinium_polyedra.AAC.2
MDRQAASFREALSSPSPPSDREALSSPSPPVAERQTGTNTDRERDGQGQTQAERQTGTNTDRERDGRSVAPFILNQDPNLHIESYPFAEMAPKQ